MPPVRCAPGRKRRSDLMPHESLVLGNSPMTASGASEPLRAYIETGALIVRGGHEPDCTGFARETMEEALAHRVGEKAEQAYDHRSR